MSSGVPLIYAILILAAVPIAAGAFIYMSEVDRTSSPSDLDLRSIRLIQAYDGARFDVVHVEMTFTVDRSVLIRLGGDIVDVKKPAGNHGGWTVVHNSNGMLVHYSGQLLLKEPKAVGDEVTILIRHAGSVTEAVVEVEGT